MELTAQISALEEEVKVLKGEIKSILTEIRTAVLTQDNPFAPEAGVPVFRPVERSLPASQPLDEGNQEAEEGSAAPESGQTASSEPAPPGPPVAQAEPAASLPNIGGGPKAAPGPEPEQGAAPMAPSVPTIGGGPQAVPQAEPEREAAPMAWSVPTIAGLVAWADETASRIGPAHLQMVLELARFAGLIRPEAEGPLLKIIKLASSRKDSAAASVNDCLVALRQLEAIFKGEDSNELALRRRGGRS